MELWGGAEAGLNFDPALDVSMRVVGIEVIGITVDGQPLENQLRAGR